MSPSTTKSALWRGVYSSLPFIIVVVPFAMLFGVAATEAGLPIEQVMGFTVLVVAGASQFTALQFMIENAPVLVILASALAVNLRMAMYSAAITPYLGDQPLWKRALLSYVLVDQTYNLAILEFEENPNQTTAQRTAFFVGCSLPLIPLWIGFTWVGAALGGQIPPEYGLDFALPIAFLAMVAPALRTVAHIAAAVTSVVLALALGFIPLNLGLLAAAIIAMMVGAEVERRMA
ncbi:putative branched-subunit amino acid permease [Litoreibacter halocynthiae]|uniref:Putative branched-subunit amino acid permease n=1 Tax=Litoreibacter halocynthiae TaxID=1242689 RepID=A0A4R7LH40_9RHOB|nr:AzlC family ABC transporter permease [Litoreibacter halocynthiae]TDT73962.1 putative branched-subunit amino acid permease [Litoreibacter halocynthiae]